MPQRKVVQTVVLLRDGERIVPQVGKPFNFTAEELKRIEEVNPDAVAKIVDPGTDEGKLVTLTQAEIDQQKQQAIDDAIAKFKKEQGIKDDAENTDGGADKNAAGTTASKKQQSGKNDKSAADAAGDDI